MRTNGRDFPFSLAATAIAVAGTLVATRLILGAGGDDLIVMAVALSVTAALGLTAGLVVPARFASIGIREQLALLAAVCLATLASNLAVAASLMFISGHDLRLLFVLLVFALVATAGPAVLVSGRISNRIRDLAAATGQIAAGDLHARVQVDGDDEVSQLGREFNSMAEALLAANARREQLEETRRNLFASVSHDLRTPLTSIQLMVESLTDGVVTDAETQARYLQTLAAELRRLSLLIDDLFELARIESGELQLRLQAIRVDQVLTEAVAAFAAQAERAYVRLRFVSEPTPPVLADPARLSRVVHNLLSNSLRHTPHDGTIELRATTDRDSVTVSVIDTGDGIAAEDAPRVFERFFRGETSRSKAGGGSGLGLSIAQAIIEAHGGRIWLDPSRLKGTAVAFSVPIAEGQRAVRALDRLEGSA